MMIKDWGFIFKGDGSESATFNNPDLQTRIVGVETLDEAIIIATTWADQGVQLIELCGWFGEAGTEKLVDAVGDRVAIGYIVASPKTAPLLQKLLAG